MKIIERSLDELDEKGFDELKDLITKSAMEALMDLWARLPFDQQTVLLNGKKATFKPFFPPKIKNDGVLKCGIDLKFDDGSGHIEFIICQTGWGGNPKAWGVDMSEDANKDNP